MSQTDKETLVHLFKRAKNTVKYLCPGKRPEAELLEAAEQVGDSIRHLVKALKQN